MSPIVGGFSDPKCAAQDVQDITNAVKLQLEVRVNGRYDIFRAILYRIQIVAGANYLIKVQVADTEYVHLKVFVGLPPENLYPALVSFQTGKTRDDPLDDF
ncbi:cystatin-A-like [Manacus vitellinus]|uniref:cystatin-A-like n=1 Tax=Manacus vitellinus TaxID=328815 RepID=UPI0008478720|nr:cystatin-A-like [Manacus vitellinus]